MHILLQVAVGRIYIVGPIGKNRIIVNVNVRGWVWGHGSAKA